MADVIEITAEVRERELRLTSIPMMPSGSRNHLRIRVTFDAEWDGTSKTLVAYRDLSHPYHVPLGLDGTALIPHEVLAEQGVAYLGVFGIAGDQRITSTIVRYGVNEGAVTEGLQPSDPTPEMWEQLISAVNEVRQAAESAMRGAQTAAQGAQQSEQAAAGSATQADGAATRAETAADTAATSAQAAETAKTDAQTAQRTAAQSAADAKTAATRAEQASGNLSTAVTQAQDAAQAAQQSATQAQDYAKSAGDSAASAAQAQRGASDAETAARQSAAQAQRAQETATQAATEAGESARQAKQSQTAAAGSATSAQASAAEATEQAGAAEGAATRAKKSAEAAKTAVGQIGNLIDDTGIKFDKTWSSRNIVDMLCPPIDETGNPVVCYPVVGYPLGVTASWEPYQDGVGDPSSENIRPIHGRDSVVVRRLGHNLVDLPDVTATSYNELLNLTPEQLSKFNALPRGVPLWFYADIDGYANGELVCVVKGGAHGYIRKNGSGKLNAGEITQVRIVGGSSAAGERHYKNLMVGLHSGLTYQPYTAQINTVDLIKPIYGGEVNAVTGDGSKTWRHYTLTADMPWEFSSKNNIIYANIAEKDWAVHKTGKCSHLKYLYDFATGGIFVAYHQITIGRSESTKWTVESWKSYLTEQINNGTPVQVAILLTDSEYEPFTATGSNPIPALSGANTILTDADTVTITGRADPKRYTDQKVSELFAAYIQSIPVTIPMLDEEVADNEG